jgi:hypothetical protein
VNVDSTERLTRQPLEGGRTLPTSGPQVLRAICGADPRAVFLENVAERPIDDACEDLSVLGYTSARDRFCASEVGCPSPRVRWFALAYLDGEGELLSALNAQVASVPEALGLGHWADDPDMLLGVDDGTSSNLDRLRCLGNGVVPQQAALAWSALMARLCRS